MRFAGNFHAILVLAHGMPHVSTTLFCSLCRFFRSLPPPFLPLRRAVITEEPHADA